MIFHYLLFLLCLLVYTTPDLTKIQVDDLGNYLDGVEHNCRPAILDPMIRHLEEMHGLERDPDKKVLLMVAATSALGCSSTSECIMDEFSKNYGNHSIPLECKIMSENSDENMTILEIESTKQQFYIILGTFLKDTKRAINKKTLNNGSLVIEQSEQRIASNSSNNLICKLEHNALFIKALREYDDVRLVNETKDQLIQSPKMRSIADTKLNHSEDAAFYRVEETDRTGNIGHLKNANETKPMKSKSNKTQQAKIRRKRETHFDALMHGFDQYENCDVLLAPMVTWLRAPLENSSTDQKLDKN